LTKLKKVTLKVIADMMGMTPATISKALRDGNDISEETRKQVKELAAQLGYRPNIMARSLISRRSFMLGVIVPDLRISFFSEVARGIYEEADLKGYVPIIMIHDENPAIEKRNIEFLSALPVDGLLLNAAAGQDNHKLFLQISKEGCPIVCYDRALTELNFSSVTIDDADAAFKLTSELVKNGRKNILFLGPQSGFSVAEGRYKGYTKALKSHHIPLRNDYIVDTELYIQDSYHTMKKVLNSGLKPDAVLCVGGLVAFGAGLAIVESPLKVPDEIVVAEFGDNDIIARLGVPFYTINQNPYEMGRTAADLLIDLIENKDRPIPPKHIFIDTQLLYRDIGAKSFNIHELNIYTNEKKHKVS
jgi:DNA-binding LacI/PurR family transcriptional regulator